MTSPSIGKLIEMGSVLLLLAFFFQNITIADRDYRVALATGLVLPLMAGICFAIAFRNGGSRVRWVCGVLLLPTILMVADFVRRAPHIFG